MCIALGSSLCSDQMPLITNSWVGFTTFTATATTTEVVTVELTVGSYTGQVRLDSVISCSGIVGTGCRGMIGCCLGAGRTSLMVVTTTRRIGSNWSASTAIPSSLQ